MSEMNALVNEYNTLTGKSLKRFSSLEEGRARIEKIKEKLSGGGKTESFVEGEKKKKAGIKNSWDDPKVRAARSSRVHVTVAGHGEYDSVAKAFIDLKLPKNKIVLFRGRLRDTGKETISDGDKTYEFSITNS